MQPKSVSSTVRGLTEIFLLALMMWPAPIPVGHRHYEYSSRVSDHQLASHLQCFHGGFSNSENWPDDWHWHWIYPADEYASLDVDDVSVYADQMVPTRYLDAITPPRISQLDYIALRRAIGRTNIPLQRRNSFQGVALLHSRQSLPELLGVIRC